MNKKYFVESICTQTGISKRDLASWLGVDHSLLSRYIAGTRSLPLRAVQHLLFLHQQLSDLPPLASSYNDHDLNIEAHNWQQQADECQERLNTLKDRYKTMCKNSTASVKALQLLDALAADTVMLTPKKLRWIEERRYQAEKLAAESNRVAIQKLGVQIVLVQKEAEVFAALLKGQPL